MSALANVGAKLKPLRWLGERLGISARRRLPAFARHRDLTRRVAEAQFSDNADVLVFADSFTKAFRPEVIPAAARVLRSTGAEVGCTADACCGLTWVSTGQRDGATRRLANLVDKLDDGTERDIVVLEPSCAATIRDEAPKLVGGDAAERVARRVLGKWGVADVSESSSCCGVAGNFGFEAEHFDVSMRVAEHSIIPALERGGEGALVLTDGFSCTMQVSQIDPERETEHLAIAMDPEGPARRILPE